MSGRQGGGLQLPALAEAAERALAHLVGPGVRVDVAEPGGRRLVGADGGVTLIGQGLIGRAAMHRTPYDDPVTGMAAHPVLDGPRRGVLVAVLSGTVPAGGLGRAADALAPLLHAARAWCTDAGRVAAAESFVERAIDAQEGERARLARDIHDGVSQRLAGLGFHLSAALSLVGTDDAAAREQLRAARELAELAGAETRAAIGDLHPPVLDDLGLAAALASLAGQAGRRPDAPAVGLCVEGDASVLPAHVQTALYRIAQEALANALRHAGASSVDVVLECEDRAVTLVVEDDGGGFDASADGAAARHDAFGLRGMRERAELLGGGVAVTSWPGRGTRVRAQVPVRPPA